MQNQLTKNNLAWVDVSKGLVICLMVIGHSGIPEWLSRWIWSFHMPFFFIISALFSSWDKEFFFHFSQRKAKRLLIPFVIYSVINIVIYPYVISVSHLDFIKSVLTNGWEGIALWFIPIFYLSLIFCKLFKGKYLIPISILCIIIACLLCSYGIILPWTLSSLPFAAFLMIICRKYSDLIRQYLNFLLLRATCKTLITNIVVFFAASYAISQYWRLDMAFNKILPIIPILIGICAGSLFAISLSILLSKLSKLLTMVFVNIGRNTFEIMALSQVIIATLNHYFNLHTISKYIYLIIFLGMIIKLRKLAESKCPRV